MGKKQGEEAAAVVGGGGEEEEMEIISIGSLYTGPFHNKYWSSTRGKDRYPYPVQYEARQSYNGSSYKMQIHQGPKGPLFLVTPPDGATTSGHTPEMAWDNLLRKTCSHSNISHRKTLSSKLDAAELFGFKNPLVQRLLRELVAKSDGAAEPCVPSSLSISDGDSKNAYNNDRCQESNASKRPDSLQCTGEIQLKGKRRKKHRLVETSTSSTRVCKLASPDDYKSTGGVASVDATEEPLDVLQTTELERSDFSKLPEDIVGSLDANLDDIIANAAPSTHEKTTCIVNKELTVMDTVVQESSGPELHAEENICASDSNESSQKNDSDSVSQDVAKSMISLLLPQAAPLLKTSSSNKRRTPGHSKNDDIASFMEVPSNPAMEHLIVTSSRHFISVIPDSFNNEKEATHEVKELIIPRNAEADPKDEELVDGNLNNSTISHGVTVEIKDIFCYDEVQLHLSDSCQVNNHHALQSGGMDLKNISECTENMATGSAAEENVGGLVSGECIMMKDRTAETGQTPVAGVANKVYTRRNLEKMKPENIGRRIIAETTGTLAEKMSTFEPHKGGLVDSETRVGGQLHCNSVVGSESPLIPVSQGVPCASRGTYISNSYITSTSNAEEPRIEVDEGQIKQKETMDEVYGHMSSQDQEKGFCYGATGEPKPHKILELADEVEETVEPVGCYNLPMPVCSLMLRAKVDEIYICALCGLIGHKDRTLFLYKILTEEENLGSPSMVGHTSVILPSPTDIFGGEVAPESSVLQLTPDGLCIAFLASVKAPRCSEMRVDCLCSACKSDCIEDNSVKIVKVESGYVSLAVKLSTVEEMKCLLVLEPNQLIAAGESGILHLWTMDTSWSAPVEEFVIQANDYTSTGILELKSVPNSPLVVGHNGFGEFTAWDISKGIYMTRFSAPSTSVYQFIPISLYSEPLDEITSASKSQWLEHDEYSSSLSLMGQDIAIRLLVSESKIQYHKLSSDCWKLAPGRWGLALLQENMLVMGNTYNLRASAVGALPGQGIMGTTNGLAFMWDLSTGTKLCTLRHFIGGVSCISTTDDSRGFFAVASNKCHLMVYQRKKELQNINEIE